MSVKTPIFTVTCACAVPHASAALKAARPNRRFIAFLLVFSPETGADLQFSPETGAGFSFRREPAPCSDSQIVVQLFHVRVQFRIDETFDDSPVFHDEIATGDGRREAEILLDQENGEALLLEGPNGAADLLDDDRREAFGRLVEQEQARARGQDEGAGGDPLLPR